jgi:hypothetical protein
MLLHTQLLLPVFVCVICCAIGGEPIAIRDPRRDGNVAPMMGVRRCIDQLDPPPCCTARSILIDALEQTERLDIPHQGVGKLGGTDQMIHSGIGITGNDTKKTYWFPTPGTKRTREHMTSGGKSLILLLIINKHQRAPFSMSNNSSSYHLPNLREVTTERREADLKKEKRIE